MHIGLDFFLADDVVYNIWSRALKFEFKKYVVVFLLGYQETGKCKWWNKYEFYGNVYIKTDFGLIENEHVWMCFELVHRHQRWHNITSQWTSNVIRSRVQALTFTPVVTVHTQTRRRLCRHCYKKYQTTSTFNDCLQSFCFLHVVSRIYIDNPE